VAGGGVDGVAEMVVGVTEAVPCVGLTVVIAEFSVPVQGLLAIGQRLLVHSEEGVVPADGVEGACLPGTVAGCLVQGQSSVGVMESLPVAALLPEDPPEAVMGVSLAYAVAEFPVQVQCVP